MRVLVRRLMLALLAAGQAPGSPARAAAPPVPARDDPAPAAARLEQMAALARRAAAEIPEESRAPKALAAKLGRDPGAIFRWVRDQTDWVPYQGQLRGAEGVLMDRLGNSLDRATLLAELLASTRRRVRLAHANLPAEVAQEMLARLRPVRGAVAPEDRSPAADEALLQRLVGSLAVEPAEVRRRVQMMERESAAGRQLVERKVEEQTAALAAVVGAPEAGPADAGPPHRLASLRDHWWVQLDQGGTWVDLDVTLPDAEPGPAPSAAELTVATDRLDPSLRHTITIRAIIEQWADGTLKEVEVLAKVFQTSQLPREPIVFRQVPVDAAGIGARSQHARQAIQAVQAWVPQLLVDGRTFVEAQFDERGDVKRYAGGAAAGGLGRATGGLFGGAALAGAGRRPELAAKRVLSAQWLEYQIDSPGAATRRLRRDVFDLLGPAARRRGSPPAPVHSREDKLRLGLACLSPVMILPVAAQPSSEWLEERSLRWLEQQARQLAGRAAGSSSSSSSAAELRPELDLYSLSFARTQRFREEGLHLARANLLTYRYGYRLDRRQQATARRGFDIVFNEVEGHGPEPAGRTFMARLRQGVRDTVLEQALLHPCSGRAECRLVATAPATLDRFGARPKLIRPSTATDLRLARFAPDVRAQVENEMAAGHVLAIPVPAHEEQPVTWWRIDPRTGTTLGMAAGGGAAFVEYKKSLTAADLAKLYGEVFAYIMAMVYCEVSDILETNTPAKNWKAFAKCMCQYMLRVSRMAGGGLWKWTGLRAIGSFAVISILGAEVACSFFK